MTRRRVAVIFDDRVRPETTGVYCRRALARMADVEHFRPDELAQIPANRFDLYVNIDDGLRYVLPAHLRPAVWWAIDTHLDGNWSVQKAATFDGVFTAQRAGVELMRSAGIRNVHWLPLACDPEFHQRYDVSKRFDVCFVGNLMPGPRVELIQRLQAKFSSMYVGRDYFHAMAQRYSESRVVFNRSVGPDINMRVFETLACGSLLVTNDLSSDGLNEFFQDGVHLATYRDAEELLERVAFYLEHETQRECIAATGRSEVLAKHTYEHRMRHLLEITSAWSASQRQKRSAPGRLIDHQRDQSVGINVRTPSVPAVARPLTNKSPHYFRHPRPEVANLVPSDATHILDVGCGIGCLGEALRQRQRCRVVGIELDSKAATEAERRLDLVLQGNVESDPFEFPAATFDCIICADVLEHTREPLHVLRRVHQWLSAGGCLVLSIPNVRHLDVITSLAEGRWEYESAGLLDEDHVRFFCRSDVERLLYRAGFEIDRQEVVPGPGHQAWLDAGRPLVLEARGVTVRCTSPEEAEEFFAYQYVIRARRRNLSKEILRNRLIDRHSDDFSSAGIETLRKQYSWPARRPCVPFPAQHSGWFIDGARLILARVLGRHVRVVVEVGSWLGASTRFIADQAPQATVIAIDHWQGSPEHQTRTPWNVLLGHLYETFVALNDQYRDRIVPVRCEAQQGLKLIAELGISPDVIYLDSDHSYQSTRDLIALCRVLFPESVLVGDDFDAGGVQQAVEEVAKNQCLEVATRGTQWRAWMLTSPGQMEPARESIDDHGLTSIIIATYNQLACTQACLESIRMRTDEPYEVIVVDNGSTDGTPAFLKQYPEITLIPNQANRGFPAAMNQGLRAARGRNLLLLNNDTVVTTGWLTRLLGALHSEPCIGVVGPVSNQVSGPQQIPVTYQNLSQLDSFAWQHGKRFSGLVEPSARLVGFCLLFRREVLERIGVLDERFGVGCFEDDDYCLRARQAGFETVIANDAFVHHSGSQTFRHSAVDLDRLMSRNRRKFEEKWGLRGSEPLLILGQPATGYREATSAQNEPLLERRPLPLSLCMIVRDNESTIRPCLESIRPWVDEIVVVDTGSRD